MVFEIELTAGYHRLRKSAKSWSNLVLDEREDDSAEYTRVESLIDIQSERTGKMLQFDQELDRL